MKNRNESEDRDDPVRCIEYMELNVGSLRTMIEEIDARDGRATSSRRILRFHLRTIKAICTAYLSHQLDGSWHKRAEDALIEFAPLMPDVIRVMKKVDPQIPAAVKAVQSNLG